jgi:uncharacterized protein involved in exopolysaccharide biosynthesis
MDSKNYSAALENPESLQPSPNDQLMYEEDEIDLFELFATVLKYKMMIILLVFLAGVGAVFYSLTLINIYRSEATLALRENDNSGPSIGALGGLGGMVASQLGIGGGGSLEKIEAVLNSRDLSAKIIEKYDLMPILFEENWNSKKNAWLSEKPPTMQDGLNKIKGLLSVKTDTKKSLITVGIEHKKPEIAKEIVDYYLTELSTNLREEILRDASENMRFFEEQIDRTTDPLLKEKIYALLAKEIEKETFAKAQKYYGFLVLDPPIVPDKDKKVKPKRSLICILSVFAAFFIAIFLAFVIEFVRKIKINDPERFAQITNELRLFRLGSKKREKVGVGV